MDLTNLTSSKGSDALRIRIDSSIFLIWSGVYLTTENFYLKKKNYHFIKPALNIKENCNWTSHKTPKLNLNWN